MEANWIVTFMTAMAILNVASAGVCDEAMLDFCNYEWGNEIIKNNEHLSLLNELVIFCSSVCLTEYFVNCQDEHPNVKKIVKACEGLTSSAKSTSLGIMFLPFFILVLLGTF